MSQSRVPLFKMWPFESQQHEFYRKWLSGWREYFNAVGIGKRISPPKANHANALVGCNAGLEKVSDHSGEAPIQDLITMQGSLEGQQVTVLKDDGCNTSVIAKSFVDRHGDLELTHKAAFAISHSNKEAIEKASEIVLNTEIHIGGHKYKSNWVVAYCRYDIMLGIPWHVENRPRIEYEAGNLWIGDVELPSTKEASIFIAVQNLEVKKLSSLLCKTSKQTIS